MLKLYTYEQDVQWQEPDEQGEELTGGGGWPGM